MDFLRTYILERLDFELRGIYVPHFCVQLHRMTVVPNFDSLWKNLGQEQSSFSPQTPNEWIHQSNPAISPHW